MSHGILVEYLMNAPKVASPVEVFGRVRERHYGGCTGAQYQNFLLPATADERRYEIRRLRVLMNSSSAVRGHLRK